MINLPPGTPQGAQVAPLSAIREWEQLMRQIGAMVEQCLDATARPERLYLVNQLELQIEATAHGALVGDSGYTREAAKASRAFLMAFMQFAMVPLAVDTLENGDILALTPMIIMSARVT